MNRPKLLFLILFAVLMTPSVAQDRPFALRLTVGYGDEEPVLWTGRVNFRNGRAEKLEGWRFLEPDRISLNTFEIQSGGRFKKGLTITGTGSPDAALEVDTNRGSFTVDFGGLKITERLEFLDGEAVVERLPDAVKLTDDFRQDDFPSIAASGDSAWAVWQSYSGRHDEVRMARFDGEWKHFTSVPGGSGDVWRPQVALDSRKRPVVAWSQQADGNFDLCARTFDPEASRWLGLFRLSSHPLPDIDHHLVSDEKGNLWVVWQGFRGNNSDILLRYFDGSDWSRELSVTSNPANDWLPQVAVDSGGRAHIVWDTYRSGSYDVYLRTFEQGKFGPEIPIANTPKFEAHPTVAVDGKDRVWIAWEESGVNWGKDLGQTVAPDWRGKRSGHGMSESPGIGLWDSRNLHFVVLEGGNRKSLVGDFHPTEKDAGDAYDSPQLLVDRQSNRVGLLLGRRGRSAPPGRTPYWESAVTFYKAGAWTPLLPLPWSRARISARPAADYDDAGNLWAVWPTDGRHFATASKPEVCNIYAARIPSNGSSGAPLLSPEKMSEKVEVAPAHNDEPGDVRAIRAYRSFVDGAETRIVRGDFHRHTEFSNDIGGWRDGSIHDFYRYVLDAAALDFGAVTDHLAGDYREYWFEYWWWLNEKHADMFNIPRSFTTFYAYERSAHFPDGHRNIIHTRRGVPVLRFFTQVLYDGLDRAAQALTEDDTKLLYESIRRSGGISIPHSPSSAIMGTDWRDNDAEVEPVVEIFQGLRVSSEHVGAPRAARSADDKPMGGFQEAGFLWNAYSKGYRLGTIASSDHVSTHLSYAMVYTREPTREAILEAIKKRQTYGATDNIILDYKMGEHFMGGEFSTDHAVPLKIKAIGTDTIDRVDIIKNATLIYSATPGTQKVELGYLDQDVSPGMSYYYVRVLQDDRQIAWSSPIWVNYK